MLDKLPPGAAESRTDDESRPHVEVLAQLAVLVVGMHRSGTSALSGVLHRLGVAVPEDLHPADEHNQRGYFEPRRIIDFHESLFATLGSPSNDPLPLSYDWVKSTVGVRAAEQLAEILDEEFGANPMCLFKDPRICRLMPVWSAALEQSGRAGVAILPYRDPLEVAGSLAAKAELPRPHGLFMWLQHVLLGERFTRNLPRSFVAYDELMTDWRGVVGKLERELGVCWPRDLARAGPEIDAFLSKDLRHQRGSAAALQPHDALEALCARTWSALQRLSTSPYDAQARREIDAVWADFEAGSEVFAPLVVAYQRAERELIDSKREQYEILQGELDRRQDAFDKLYDTHVRTVAGGRAQMERLRQARRKDQAAIRRLQTELAHRDREAAEHHRRLNEVEPRLAAIEGSTTWIATAKLRRVLSRHPLLRTVARRALKLAWWTLTLQLPRRLAERGAAATPAPVLAAPTPDPDAGLAGAPLPSARSGRSQGPLRIVFVSGEAHTPGHLYRCQRPAEAARRLGAEVEVVKAADVAGALPTIAAADVVFVWRTPYSEPIAAMFAAARANGASIVFDVDDLMFEPELAHSDLIDGIRSQGLSTEQVAGHFEGLRRTLMEADFGVAPTPFLAHRMRRLLKPAFVLPNGFDDDVVRKARQAVHAHRSTPADGLVRIGYATGSKTHQQDFARAAPAVARILREHPECRLVIFTFEDEPILDLDEFGDFFGLVDQIEQRPFVPLEQLPFELARFDINLAPLETGNPFCEAKSELKYFEAALVETPTVASPTEPYRLAIREGVTGFLADTPEEWYAALKTLVGDPATRARIARQALYDSLARYGADRRDELLMSIIEQIRGGPRRAARAFELDLVRMARPPAEPPHVPEHDVVFASDNGPRSDVTIVVPLYNYAGYVAEALDSVREQTLEDIDLIVVNDASTDESETVAREWLERHAPRFNRALLIRNRQNSGLAFTRNVGFAAAESAYVLPLDADNRLRPECAEQLLAALEKSGAAFAFPMIRQFGDHDAMMGDWAYDPARFVYANYIDAMAMIRRAGWADVGGYDHVRFGWEDYDLWCRFVERGLWGEQVPKVLAEYRVHGQSMLRMQTDQARNRVHLMRDMERRHPWLRVDRDPLWGPSFLAAEAELDSEAATQATPDRKPG